MACEVSMCLALAQTTKLLLLSTCQCMKWTDCSRLMLAPPIKSLAMCQILCVYMPFLCPNIIFLMLQMQKKKKSPSKQTFTSNRGMRGNVDIQKQIKHNGKCLSKKSALIKRNAF